MLSNDAGPVNKCLTLLELLMGRKPTGKTPVTNFRLPPEKRRQVVEYAKKRGVSYSDALRELIDIGLLHADCDNRDQ
jgi:hypothetical protein